MESPMRFCIHRTSAILRHMAVAMSRLDPRLKTEVLSHTASESLLAKPLVAALEDQGLNVEWDGDPAQRVCVGAAQEAGE